MMQHLKQVLYIFWTCREKIEAKRIIYALLEKKWVACASILPEFEPIVMVLNRKNYCSRDEGWHFHR